MSENSAQNDLRVDYVEFPSTDIGATKKFYTEVFRWKFEDYGPDYVAFQDGRLSGGFFRADKAAPSGAMVVMYAVDLEAVEGRVKAAGGRRFHFADPSGSELAVWSDVEPKP